MNQSQSNAVGLTQEPINPEGLRWQRNFGNVWQRARVTNVATPHPYLGQTYIKVNNFGSLMPYNRPVVNTQGSPGVAAKYSQLLAVLLSALKVRNVNGNTGIY